MKKAIGIMLGLLTFASALGGAEAQDGSEPYMTFTISGSLGIKKSTGSVERVDFESYKALKSLGEDIAVAPNPIQCEERDAKAGEESAPVVTFTTPKPMFSLKNGSAYCSIISKAKKHGVTFKIKTEVGAAGVTEDGRIGHGQTLEDRR